MKLLKGTSGASYLTASNHVSKFAAAGKNKSKISVILSGILAVMFLFATIFSSLSLDATTALADEKAQGLIEEAAKGYGVEGSEDGFYKTFEKFSKDRVDGVDNKSFAYALERLFTTRYINNVSSAVAAGGTKKPSSGNVCNKSDKAAGTLVYHNCDVPNIAAEFFQDTISFFVEQGPINAEVDVATISNQWFGLPTNVPGNSVPTNPSERSIKYTALELYGYNLKYTTYSGEWDHIKTMTEARALANFGFMDSLKMSVTTIVNGVTSALSTSIENAAGKLSSGDILGAIGGAYSGLFEGAAGGSVNTILDTSDLNVINTDSWYRVGYGSTLYGARELDQNELASEATSQFVNMISSTRPEDAKVPDELLAIKTLPEDPKEPISKCKIKDKNGDNVEWGNTSKTPGPSESDCIQKAQHAYDVRKAAFDERKRAYEARDNYSPLLPFMGIFIDKASHYWNAEGTQKLETLASWKKTHKKHFSTSDKYMMECELSTKEGNRKNSLASLKSCWGGEWNKAADIALKDVQNEINNEWVDDTVNQKALSEWLAKPENNFNAPWNRFICLNSDGSDKKDSKGNKVKVYNMDGKHNSSCSEVRPPIQNGFFGNGYPSNDKPAIDTRNVPVDSSLLTAILPMDQIFSAIGGVGLSIAVAVTRISNTILNLSFSPILETIGMDEKVILLIEGLRDSLFFPLAGLVIAFSGLTILFKAGKNRDYGKQAISVLILVATFVSGVILMYNPAGVFKVVDQIPAQVEQAIMGSIFTTGSEASDQLCTASGTSKVTTTGLDGKALDNNPATATRAILCENWRVFAFTPWVYGQWGADFEHLNASSTSTSNRMKNTNSSLVGDARVNMGAGKSVRNWALYQLDVTSSGTALTRDSKGTSGFIDPDFYRIVDMQAGPNNGAGTDSSKFENWTGGKPFNRVLVGFLAVITSLFGAFTVASFAISKITITLISSIMLLFLPFAFLIGLHAGQGRGKLKGYIGTILGLMLQRVMLISLLAIMFRVIIGFGTSATSYTLLAFAVCTVCAIFLSFKKTFIGWIETSVSSTFGPSMASGAVTNPGKTVLDKMPSSIKNYANQGKDVAHGAATGAIGGFLSGHGAIKGGREAAQAELARTKNRQRHAGYKGLQSAAVAVNAGKKAATEELNARGDFNEMRRTVAIDTEAGFQKRVKNNLISATTEAHDENLADENVPKFDEINQGFKKPFNKEQPAELRTGNKAKTMREVARLAEIEEKVNRLKEEDRSQKWRETQSKKKLGSDDINSIADDQERLRRRRRIGPENPFVDDSIDIEEDLSYDKGRKIAKLEKEAGNIRGKIIKREDKSYTFSLEARRMREELKRLITTANEAIDHIDKKEGE